MTDIARFRDFVAAATGATAITGAPAPDARL